MKFIKISTTIIIVLVMMCFCALVACDKRNGDNNDNANEDRRDPETEEIATDSAVFAIGAVTSAKLLYTSGAGVELTANETGDKMLGQADDFNRYFNMLDGFLDSADIAIVDTESDSALFERKLSITGKGINGESVSHIVYYTQTLNGSDRETFGDETVSVERYSLTGALSIGDVSYSVSGSRTLRTETEGRESELTDTVQIVAYAENDPDGSHVEVTHVSESESEGNESEVENEYSYRVYGENGTLIEQAVIEFERGQEHGEVETEYAIRYTKGATKGYYEIEREIENGKTTIEVAYDVDGERGRFTVIKSADGYVYGFDNDRTYKDYAD